MTPHQAIAFVHEHGVVLESAKGSVPSLAEAIAGEPIPGSWWAHPRSHEIFAATRAVRESQDVLVCRLVDGKVTFIHRKLWPALVRCAHRFPRKRIAQLCEHHTESGRHVAKSVPFPKWVPAQALKSAARLSEEQARKLLGSWAS